MNIATTQFQPQIQPQPQQMVPGFGFPQQAPVMDPMTQMMGIMTMLFATMLGGMAGQEAQGALPAAGGFGGAPSGGSPGISNFLGGGGGGAAPVSSGGGGSTFGAGGAAPVDIGSIQGGTDFGRSLAQDAVKNANGPGGYCFKWVSNALRRHGVETSGASAYMAADQLAKSDKFREVQIDPKDFKKLPPGAVVVWNKGPGKPHGHISIATGDGREASDKMRDQITNYGTQARVFLPK